MPKLPNNNKKTNPPAVDIPEDVAAIRKQIKTALNTETIDGRKAGNAKFGVYAFFDYDGEPIYVGRTFESLRSRIGRHLTNQRSDAVAMNVLDPFEVAEIEMWPLWDLEGATKKDAMKVLNATEFSVFQRVLQRSSFNAVLNEKAIAPSDVIPLPNSYRVRIIPDPLYNLRKHPDIRIARRATTIAALARVISEREVSKGLRQTLVTQARRLQQLATKRFEEIGEGIPTASPRDEE